MKTEDLPRFTDEEAEHLFGISVSRLRAAQRYELAISDTARVGTRYIRVWRADMVLRVYLAQQFSAHAGLSFSVGACALALTPDSGWAKANQIAFVTPESLCVRLYVINRNLIVADNVGEKPLVLGNIFTDVDGRAGFMKAVRAIDNVDTDLAPLTSKFEFNPDPEIEKFRRLFKKAQGASRHA